MIVEALQLLHHCLQTGSTQFTSHFLLNSGSIIEPLTNFHHIDSDGVDRGYRVRREVGNVLNFLGGLNISTGSSIATSASNNPFPLLVALTSSSVAPAEAISNVTNSSTNNPLLPLTSTLPFHMPNTQNSTESPQAHVNELTNEELVALQTLYRLNVPALEIVFIIE